MTQDTLNRGDLGDMLTLLRDHHMRRHDVIAPARALTVNDEGGVELHEITHDIDLERGVGEQEQVTMFDPNDHANWQLFSERCGIPRQYVKRMLDGHADLLAYNANHWLEADERSFLLRTLQPAQGDDGPNVLRAVLSDRYKVMDDLDVTMSVLDALRSSEHVNPEQLNIRCSHTAQRMYMRITAPDVAVSAPDVVARYRDPRSGKDGRDYPLMWAGVEITNSEVGVGSFQITPCVEVQVCTNGMKRTKDLMRSVHLGEKLDEGVVKWSDATYENTLSLIKSKTTDAVATFLSPGYLQSVIDDMREMGTPLAEPKKAVEHVTKQLRFTQADQDAILTSFLAGGDLSALGVGQAITNVAQDRDPDAAYDLENVAWKAMEMAATS